MEKLNIFKIRNKKIVWVRDCRLKISGWGAISFRRKRGFISKDKVIEQKDKKKSEPFIEYALIAAKEAIDDSSWKVENDEQSMNTGVMVGSGIIGGLDGIRKVQKI